MGAQGDDGSPAPLPASAFPLLVEDNVRERGEKRATTHLGSGRSPEKRIMALVGERGGWHPDALAEATGMPFTDLVVALVMLELSGRIERNEWGYVYPPQAAASR